MKRLFVLILAIFLLTGTASAQQAKKKRVADKKFWLAAGLMVAASIADAESTVRWVKACPTCTELNTWLYGKRPSRKRIYLALLPITAAEIWGVWRVKKDDDKQGTKTWVVIPVVHIGAHGGAAIYNYTSCPARGSGCRQ